MVMTVDYWILVLILGALAGALGQTVRVVVGLKKQNDEAAAENVQMRELIVPSRLVVSLIIGAAAGAVAAIVMDFKPADELPSDQIFMLAAAGYAGADFIEGFAGRFLPGAIRAMPR